MTASVIAGPAGVVGLLPQDLMLAREVHPLPVLSDLALLEMVDMVQVSAKTPSVPVLVVSVHLTALVRQ